jgi:hypothetical protein
MLILGRLAGLAHAVTIGLAGLIALAGCASVPQEAAPPAAPSLHGALLVVRLSGLLEPPAAVRADVALQGQPAGTSIAGRLQQSVPGQYADYLLALALPPERYVITAVRHGASSSGKQAPPALATMNVPFEVKPSDPAYLGRLVLVPSAAGVVVQDHFEEDTVLFRATFSELRTADIGRDILPLEALAGSTVAPDPAVPPPPPPGSALEVTAVTEEAAQRLTSPSARAAFKEFLLLKPPRAFAISEGGAHGYAGGARSVERALRACARRSKDETCRLFVVDGTLITGDSCAATLRGGLEGARIEPGCAPGSARKP